MRIAKYLRTDQDTIAHFLAVLGSGSVMLSNSKRARPRFFIIAHRFIKEFIEEGFFRKEELLIEALEEGGFPTDDGPIAAMRNDQKKSHDSSDVMLAAAKHWQAGDDVARSDVGWATSEYTTAVRLHLERLKNLIFPLLEQTISVEDEHKVSERMNNIIFEGHLKEGPEKYIALIGELEEELGDWT